MSEADQVVPVHPEGECQTAASEAAQAASSVDTFAGKVFVKWSAEAAVRSLGLMPFFIEFLKTSGLFDKWVEGCPPSALAKNDPHMLAQSDPGILT